MPRWSLTRPGFGLGSIHGAWRRGLLAVGIVAELSVLVAYKYADFSISILQAGFAGLGLDLIALPRLNLLLPVGLSFYTFSAISYMIDVERGTIAPERHLGRLRALCGVFPKAAGRPDRARRFLSQQLTRPVSFDAVLVAGGLQLMLLGLFKKVVIADRLAEFVDPGFANPALQSPVTVLIAVYFYAFQIYCDFSGYSDIAIGAAAVLGIRPDGEFPPSLLRRVGAGVLGPALAHLADAVVPRLPLYPARRQPRRQGRAGTST